RTVASCWHSTRCSDRPGSRYDGSRQPADTMTNDIRAAGGLVLRTHIRKGLQVLIAHRPGYNDWTLPKGKVDRGEDEVACAVREVSEETGYRCVPIAEHGMSSYRVNAKPKHVAWFTMQPIE